MAKARRPTGERRQEIIDAALALLGELPLDRLSTRRIARELGISQPALFRHFRSREAILIATVSRARDLLADAIAAVVAEPGCARERMRRLLERVLRYVERHPGLPRLLFADLAADAGPLRAELTQVLGMQRALVGQLFREGQRDGSFRDDVEPDRAAMMVVSLVQGLVLQWQANGRAASLGDALPSVFELWLGGVAGDGVPRASATPSQAGARLFDVRPLLAAGRDPLDAVVRAMEDGLPGSLLAIVAPFRPRPLEAFLRSKGHSVEAHALADGAWTLLVVAGGRPRIDDLRDRPAPEPLEAVLAAAANLDGTYIGWVPRYPRLLLPKLSERGLDWQAVELPDGSSIVHLRGGE